VARVPTSRAGSTATRKKDWEVAASSRGPRSSRPEPDGGADDLSECAELGVRRVDQTRMSCPRPRLLRIASAYRARACALSVSLGGRVAELVVDPCPGGVGLLPGGRGFVGLEALADKDGAWGLAGAGE
jgi:hypothetical protein